MTDAQILALLSPEYLRGARSLLLDGQWGIFKTIGCNGSIASDAARLRDLGLGAYRRRDVGSATFTRNERGAAIADKLRKQGYRSDGRRY